MSPNVRSVQMFAVRPVGPLRMTPLGIRRPFSCVGPRKRSNRTNFVVNQSLAALGSHAFQPDRSLPFRRGSHPSSRR